MSLYAIAHEHVCNASLDADLRGIHINFYLEGFLMVMEYLWLWEDPVNLFPHHSREASAAVIRSASTVACLNAMMVGGGG